MLRADESADVIPYEVVFERYQRYADRVFEVFGIESPEDREDLVQELFMDFLKVSHSTPQKNVRAWIAKAARHRAIDFIIRAKRPKHMPKKGIVALDIDIDGHSSTPHEIAIANEEVWSKIDTVVSEISETDWEIFLLQFEEGLSTKEIAERVSLNDGAIRMRLVRVREKMRAALNKLAS